MPSTVAAGVRAAGVRKEVKNKQKASWDRMDARENRPVQEMDGSGTLGPQPPGEQEVHAV